MERWGEDPIDSLQGPHGHIGYLGHLNWMMGAYKLIGGDEEFDSLFHDTSHALARRLRASLGSCLRTYPHEALYVPDNVVVIASLANYARIHNGELQDVVNQWVKDAQDHMLDPELNLLSFHVDEGCQAFGGARGSGAGWNSFYLPFIDRGLADQQYARLLSHLKQTRLLTGIREYPRGVFGLGDVDSGPVLLGLSPSGTGFAIGGATHARDQATLSSFLLTAEVAGFSWGWSGSRRYLIAPLVGDAIILAMKTARVWDTVTAPNS